MKNIHLLPTEKPSRLFDCFGKLSIGDFNATRESLQVTNQHIYITFDEEPKNKDYYWDENKNKIKRYFERRESSPSLLHRFKIILTTDQNLIAKGVQAIDDEFLEWFVKNPNCKFVETKLVEFEVDMGLGDECIEHGNYYKIILPEKETKFSEDEFEMQSRIINKVWDEEPKQETLEESIKPLANFIIENATPIEGQDGAYYHFSEVCKLLKLQSKKMYSEEDCYKILHNLMTDIKLQGLKINDDVDLKNWFEKFNNKTNENE